MAETKRPARRVNKDDGSGKKGSAKKTPSTPQETPREPPPPPDETPEEEINRVVDATKELQLDMDLLSRTPSGRSGDRPPPRDFDKWAAKPNDLVEAHPDHCFFRIFRNHPTEDAQGNYIGGYIRRKIQHPIDLDWMREQFPDGGRYSVQFCGPREGRAGVILTTFSPVQLSSQEYDARSARFRRGYGRDDDEEEIDEGADEDEQLLDGPDEPIPPGGSALSEKLLMKFVDSTLDEKKRLERRVEEERRAARRREMDDMRPPYPPTSSMRHPRALRLGNDENGPPKDKNDVVSRGFEKLIEVVATKPPAPPSIPQGSDPKVIEALQDALQAARKENLELHNLINSIKDDGRSEVSERLREQREGFEAQLREQRQSFEEALKDARDAAKQAIVDLKEQHRDTITNLKDDQKSRAEQLRERITDLKDALRQTREDLKTTQSELNTARSAATEARAKIAALETTKSSEIAAIKAEARAEAAEKAKDSAESNKPKDDGPSDPVDRMVESFKKAKSLKEVLEENFGGGSSSGKGGETKPSRLDQIVDIGAKVAGSKEIRGLAGTITEAITKGVTSVAQDRANQAARNIPSTEALAAAHRSVGYRRNPPPPRQQTTAPVPAESPQAPVPADAPPPAPSTGDPLVDGITGAAQRVQEIKAQAEMMLDEIEDLTAMSTPVPEAAETLITKLQEITGATRAEVIENVKGTTAEGTLDELGFDHTRLSKGALKYFNELIQHASELV